MAKPIILTLDDEPEVLRAIELDLRRQYGADYRVMRADTGEKALGALKQLKLRNEVVALFLVDQRMPQMTGVEFLEQALQLFPDAKRALLTAYADTEAAIRAINDVGINHYLIKPWDPPEERLYPIVQDLLDDWQAAFRPPFQGLHIIDHRWSPASHHIRDFLARNHVPYRWLDIEISDEARDKLAFVGASNLELPVLIFEDGSTLSDPSNTEIAEKIGLQTRAEQPFYDLIIIGAGPAGLAAAVYGASEGLRTVMIEKDAPGGQAGTSSRIENYLGFPAGLSGGDLARRGVAQAKRFGVEILNPQEAINIRADGPYRIVTFKDGSELSSHAIIIATGVSYHRLDAPGVQGLTGRGIYYGAALSEALNCQSQDILIVGAGNSAGQAAMYFAKYASTVSMIVRGHSLTKSMSQYLIDQIDATSNILVRLNTEIVEAYGDDHLESVKIIDKETNTHETLETPAVFIFIGAEPHTDWLASSIECDKRGFILTGPALAECTRKRWKLPRPPYLFETIMPGVFAVGDVRSESVKRVATSVGEGAMAVSLIHQYLKEL